MTTIYAALAAVMSDVDHVAKRDVNQHQRFNFRGIDSVVNAVGPALRKHQVIVVPRVLATDYETVATTTGKPSTACRVSVEYTFYGPDGDSIPCSVAAEAWDAGDKAAPKAMSVAFRTALLQALALPTDEPDPDSQTYERAPQTQPAPRQQESPRIRAGNAAVRLWPNASREERRELIESRLRAIGAQSIDAATPDQWLAIAEDLELAA